MPNLGQRLADINARERAKDDASAQRKIEAARRADAADRARLRKFLGNVYARAVKAIECGKPAPSVKWRGSGSFPLRSNGAWPNRRDHPFHDAFLEADAIAAANGLAYEFMDVHDGANIHGWFEVRMKPLDGPGEGRTP